MNIEKQVFTRLPDALLHVQTRFQTMFSGRWLLFATTADGQNGTLENWNSNSPSSVWKIRNAGLRELPAILRRLNWFAKAAPGRDDNFYEALSEQIETKRWAESYTCTFVGSIIALQPCCLASSVHYSDVQSAIRFNRSILGLNFDDSEETLLELDGTFRNYFAIGDWRVDYPMIEQRYPWEVWSPNHE